MNITFDNSNIISYETFKLYQDRKRTRELIDAASRDIREARQALEMNLLMAGWPADLMPYVNPQPRGVDFKDSGFEIAPSATVMAAWWVNNNGVPT